MRYKLINKKTNEVENLHRLDQEICKILNVPVDEKYWGGGLFDWPAQLLHYWHENGNKTLEMLVKLNETETNLLRKRMLLVGKFLIERYTLIRKD